MGSLNWLCAHISVLRHAAINRRIQQERRARREAEAAAAVAAWDPGSERPIEMVQLQRMLADLVLELPDELRRPLLMRYFDGLSSAAICARLGVPASTCVSGWVVRSAFFARASKPVPASGGRAGARREMSR